MRPVPSVAPSFPARPRGCTGAFPTPRVFRGRLKRSWPGPAKCARPSKRKSSSGARRFVPVWVPCEVSMAVKLHPHFDEIKLALQKLLKKGKPFSAVCYRCTEPQFADQIAFGLGSQIHGGRWTPKGSFPAVYLCETVEAALQEYLARGRRMKLPDYKSLPMVVAWIKVKAANLLDTTDAEVAAVINPFLQAEKIHWRS